MRLRRHYVRWEKRVLMLVVSIIYSALRLVVRCLGGGSGRRLQTGPSVILTYHSVEDHEVGRFERQMVELKNRATSVFADDSMPADAKSRVAVTFDDAFQSVFERVLPVLQQHGIPSTIFVPTGYLGRAPGWMTSGGGRIDPGDVVSEDVLARVDRQLVKIGSHTVTHPRLAAIDDRQLNRELRASRVTLERLIGSPVRLLALPYGSCSLRVISAAAAAGYERVFANIPVVRQANWETTRLIGRIDVSPNDWPIEFRLKISGAYAWIAFAIHAKRHALRRFRYSPS